MTTLQFTSSVKASLNVPNSDTTLLNQDTILDSRLGPMGYDSMYVTHGHPGDNSVTADAAFAIDGGLLYATFSTADGVSWTGQVTGGTGKFKGATGTATATETSESPYPWVWTQLAITVNYSSGPAAAGRPDGPRSADVSRPAGQDRRSK